MKQWDQVEETDESVAAEWTRLVIDKGHHRGNGRSQWTHDEQLAYSSSVVCSEKLLRKCRAGELSEWRGGEGSGGGWMCILIDSSGQVIGSGKWVGRTPVGSSPHVHGNGLSSAVSRSSRGVR